MGRNRHGKPAVFEAQSEGEIPHQPAGGLFSSGLLHEGENSEIDRLERLALGEPDAPPDIPACNDSPGGNRNGRRTHRRFVASRRPHCGHAIGDAPAGSQRIDLAWDAALRRTAHLQRERGDGNSRLAVHLYKNELPRRRRAFRPSRLLLFVADASGSMGVATLAFARDLASAILHEAYEHRDEVAMIAFRRKEAAVIFGFTNQIERVDRAIRGLSCGGTTPLPAALRRAGRLVKQARARRPESEVQLVLISDGQANAGERPGQEAVWRELAGEAGKLVSDPRLTCLMVDTTEPGQPDVAARRLAALIEAVRLPVGRLSTEAATRTARIFLSRGGA